MHAWNATNCAEHFALWLKPYVRTLDQFQLLQFFCRWLRLASSVRTHKMPRFACATYIKTTGSKLWRFGSTPTRLPEICTKYYRISQRHKDKMPRLARNINRISLQTLPFWTNSTNNIVVDSSLTAIIARTVCCVRTAAHIAQFFKPYGFNSNYCGGSFVVNRTK